jgi:23S rRNA (pseudouridine1915-N3)-methyltransferase
VILRLVHPGKPPAGPLADAARDYRGRLERHLRTDEVFVRPERADRPDALDVEAERLLAKVGPRDRLVALVVDGEPWSSEDLARRLEAWLAGGHRAVVFALGSASGLGGAVRVRARERWSLGPLTLPHDLARVVVWEQLYRAGTILRGEPYHRG